MADKPNFGEALFKGLAGGLQNLAGFLQTERNNRMQQLNFLMAQQAHQAQMAEHKVNLEAANQKLKESTRLSNMSVEEIAVEKAKAQAASEQAFQQTFLGNVLGQTPIGGVLNAVGQPAPSLPLANLIPMAQQQGLPFKFDTGMASLDLGGGQTGNVDALDFVIGQRGTAGGMDYLKKTGEFANLSDGTPKTLSAEDQQLKTQIDATYPTDIAREVWQSHLQGVDPLKVAENNYQEYVRLYTPVGDFGKREASTSPEVAKAQARAAKEAGYSPQYRADLKTVIWGVRKKQKALEYTKEEADKLIEDAKRHFKNLYQNTLNYVSANQSGE